MSAKYRVGDIIRYRRRSLEVKFFVIVKITNNNTYIYSVCDQFLKKLYDNEMSFTSFELPASDNEIMELVTPLEKAML